VAAALVLAAMLMIAALTLTSQPAGWGPSFFCMFCDERWLADVLLNVFLFVPLGVGLERLGLSPKRAFLISLVFSALIEFLQATVVTGRDSSLRDIITNSTGGWLGATLAHSRRNWVLLKASLRRWVALAMAILWSAIIASTLWALEPSIPNRRHFGQYAPTDSIIPEFGAEIFRASFHGAPLPIGAFSDQSDVLKAFRSRKAWLTATVAQPPLIAGTATIVAVVDDRKDEDLTLSQSGRDLLCHVRLRSEDIGLNSPTIRLKGAFRDEGSGSAIEIEGGLLGATIALVVRRGAEISQRELVLTPGAGWMLLYPFDLTLPVDSAIFGFLWMTAITLPLQYFWSLSVVAGRRCIASRSVPFCLALLLLVPAPRLFGARSANNFEIAGVVVALISGDQLARLAQRGMQIERERIGAAKQLS
jgi:hypothetical protein